MGLCGGAEGGRQARRAGWEAFIQRADGGKAAAAVTSGAGSAAAAGAPAAAVGQVGLSMTCSTCGSSPVPSSAVQVFSSLTATRRLLEERGLRPFLLLHPKALPDFEGIPTDRPNAGAAVVGAFGCARVGFGAEAG